SKRLLWRQRRRRHVLEFDGGHMLDKGGGVSRAARLVPARRRTGEAAILVRFALRHFEIARRAGLLGPLLDALFGMPDAVGKLAAVWYPERARRAGEHV